MFHSDKYSPHHLNVAYPVLYDIGHMLQLNSDSTLFYFENEYLIMHAILLKDLSEWYDFYYSVMQKPLFLLYPGASLAHAVRCSMSYHKI